MSHAVFCCRLNSNTARVRLEGPCPPRPKPPRRRRDARANQVLPGLHHFHLELRDPRQLGHGRPARELKAPVDRRERRRSELDGRATYSSRRPTGASAQSLRGRPPSSRRRQERQQQLFTRDGCCASRRHHTLPARTARLSRKLAQIVPVRCSPAAAISRRTTTLTARRRPDDGALRQRTNRTPGCRDHVVALVKRLVQRSSRRLRLRGDIGLGGGCGDAPFGRASAIRAAARSADRNPLDPARRVRPRRRHVSGRATAVTGTGRGPASPASAP